MRNVVSSVVMTLVGSLLLASCSSSTDLQMNIPPSPGDTLPDYSEEWTNVTAPKAALLVVQGLNNNLEVLRPLRQELSQRGFASLEVLLPGNDMAIHGASVVAWHRALRHGATELSRRYPRIPLYGIGYSAGALALLTNVSANESSPISKLVLLAPPLYLRPGIQVMKVLSAPLFALSFLRLAFPSLAPSTFRAHNHTSLNSYRTLFALQTLTHAARFRIPPHTLALFDWNDELVAAEGSSAWIKQQNGQTITVQLGTTANKAQRLAHLFPHPDHNDTTNWNALVSTIEEFFS